MNHKTVVAAVIIDLLIIASLVYGTVTITDTNLVVKNVDGSVNLTTIYCTTIANATAADVTIYRLTIESGTSFPTSPSAGRLYYRTDLNAPFIWNSTNWNSMGNTTGGVGSTSWNDITGKPDFTVYLLQNGTVPLTANWDAGGYGIYNVEAINATNINLSGNLLWNNQNRTDSVAYPISEASYLIDVSGSTYRMKNGTTGQFDFVSTNAAAVLQFAINLSSVSGGQVHVRHGTYNCNVTLKDKVHLIIGLAATGINVTIDSGTPNAILEDQQNFKILYYSNGECTQLDWLTGEWTHTHGGSSAGFYDVFHSGLQNQWPPYGYPMNITGDTCKYVYLEADFGINNDGSVSYGKYWDFRDITKINNLFALGYAPIMQCWIFNLENVTQTGWNNYFYNLSRNLGQNTVIWLPCYEFNFNNADPGWNTRSNGKTWKIAASDYNAQMAKIRSAIDNQGIQNILIGCHANLGPYAVDPWSEGVEPFVPGMRLCDILGVTAYGTISGQQTVKWPRASDLYYNYINQTGKPFIIFECGRTSNFAEYTSDPLEVAWINAVYQLLNDYPFVTGIIHYWWYDSGKWESGVWEAVRDNARQYEGNWTTSQYGIYKFYDGFESNDFSKWSGTYLGTGSSVYMVFSPVYNGSYATCSKVNGSSHYAYLYRGIVANATCYVRMYFQIDTANSNQTAYIWVLNGTSDADAISYIKLFGLGSDNATLQVANYETSTTYSYTNITGTAINTWYSLQLGFHSGAADGYIKGYFNDTLYIDETGLNTGTANVIYVRVGCAYAWYATTVYLDDVAIDDTLIS